MKGVKSYFVGQALLSVCILTLSANAQKYEWFKISEHAQFSPRDSSPNACVIFNEKYWVLGGWRFGGKEWKSYADVWESN